ncbi:SAM-dependent methyltransferase [Nocardia amamiensis]|uniref:SAM-dependent methyltransferase n=1 Tax=Nocardia amamiensis TaxID=404578 RepID=UPI000ADAE871|nr:SAM-dependent methyltransferase [Nocardia amamiensis]
MTSAEGSTRLAGVDPTTPSIARVYDYALGGTNLFDVKRAFFAGLDMVPPGLVQLHDWWPGGPALRTPWPDERLILGGVGRKP